MEQMPEWIKSQRKARHLCEQCGQRPADSAWAGTGEELCWECIENKREA